MQPGRQSNLRTVLIAATGVAAMLVPAAPALGAGQVYWGNVLGTPIAFAKLDGSGGGNLKTTGATPDDPWGVTIDSATGRIYWANNDSNTIPISYANLNGSGGGSLKTTGATANAVEGVAIDPAAGRIYWANASGAAPPISYANLNGSGGGNLTVTGATPDTPDGVAIDPAAGRIYWANFSSATTPISYANLDGSGGGNLDTTGATANEAEGVAIDPRAGRIYWANNGSNTTPISYANLDGSGGGNLKVTGATADTPGFPALLEVPSGTAAPIISGGSSPGSKLSCSQGTWAPDLLGSFLYRAPQSFHYSWTRNAVPVPGAASSTLRANAGGEYACRVTAQNHAGSTSQTSRRHGVLTATTITTSDISSKRRTASFRFKASGASSFQCALIKHDLTPVPHFAGCHSPKTYTHLKPGRYVFEVRALSAAGSGPPATRSFKISG
jgi:DNA-binding beta-propeller fold protein YncE